MPPLAILRGLLATGRSDRYSRYSRNGDNNDEPTPRLEV
jgi:hypothetical protein